MLPWQPLQFLSTYFDKLFSPDSNTVTVIFHHWNVITLSLTFQVTTDQKLKKFPEEVWGYHIEKAKNMYIEAHVNLIS